MKKNLIIGAGQLGSRHLQGLLKWKAKQEIYVVDPFESSLKMASERAQEINHNCSIFFTNELNQVPLALDLVIVATQSDVREEIVQDLIINHQVQNLILEKVLFQEIDAYYRVEKLIENTKTWVNHPRRMFSYYQKLRNNELISNSNKHFSIFGSNWGLACNALHFIDLICYLTKSKVKSLSTDWIDSEILNGKREGKIEFTGSLKGRLENGDTFIIVSKKGESTPISININYQNQKQLVIIEGNLDNEINFPADFDSLIKIDTFPIEYQSSLTTRICEDLFEKGGLTLPTYKEAMEAHLPFIQALLEFTNKEMNATLTKLPIT